MIISLWMITAILISQLNSLDENDSELSSFLSTIPT